MKCMEKLLNVENIWDGEVECDLIKGPSCRIAEENVVKPLNHSNTGKAAGPSGVVFEMTKAMHDNGV